MREHNPIQFDELSKRKAETSNKWRQQRTDEEKLADKESAKMRQRRKRALLKATTLAAAAPPKKTPAEETAHKPKTRADKEKQLLATAKATERKRNWRSKLTPQKRRRILKRRRQQYCRQKEVKQLEKMKVTITSAAEKHPRKVYRDLKKTMTTLKNKRDKMSLFKLDFLKKLLNRENTETARTMFYKRHSTYDRTVQDFYLKEAVDLPGKKNSGSKFENMVNKKVLTKTVAALYKDFRKTHPTCNISLTTFSRRRPRNVLLSSSRAFVQCLCEICVNPMLKVEKLKKFLRSTPSNVDELVSETLCKCELLYSKPCIERVCSRCGVKKIIDTWRAELRTSLEDEITWERWEKTEVRQRPS